MKIGTIGTGFIVADVLTSLDSVENASCEAVYSRKEETGRAFADRFGIGTVYTSLDALVSDPNLDTIYIASPNTLHAPQAKFAMEHGKNVILEKPFTPTLHEARNLFETADRNNVFLLEAISTLSMPNYEIAKQLVPRIGTVRMVQADYCQFSSRYLKLLDGEVTNIFNPDFAGGSLMDLNVYNVHFVVGMFGKPEECVYYANKHQNGIDTSGVLVMRYRDFLCTCIATKDTWGRNRAQIQGEEGIIYVDGGAHDCDAVSLITMDRTQMFNEQEEGKRLVYEMRDMQHIIDSKDREAYEKRRGLTLDVVDTAEKAWRSANMCFPDAKA